MQNTENLQKLINVVAKLRSPNGCPWDLEQTHESLIENIIEETYETIDAIFDNSDEDLKEELGDVLLQVIFHAQIAEEEHKFNIEDVAKTITDKLIRRHPHVFADLQVSGTDEVLENWEEIKKQEKPHRRSAMSGISRSQPALMTAVKISKRAVKTGFEWQNIESLWECVESEMDEFKHAAESNDKKHMEEELGDILFSLVNLARWYDIHPEVAMMKANRKFIKRFKAMEELSDKDLNEKTFDELDELWQKAKIHTK